VSNYQFFNRQESSAVPKLVTRTADHAAEPATMVLQYLVLRYLGDLNILCYPVVSVAFM
jgi:hypothetical protein